MGILCSYAILVVERRSERMLLLFQLIALILRQDLSALRVLENASGSLSLEQLDVVLGATIGSAQIDRRFEISVLERLQLADKTIAMEIDVEDAAWEMMKSKEYQNAKCDYGSLDDSEIFFVAIPMLSKRYSNEMVGIVEGEMRFRRFVFLCL
jgi:hypothetical protein